MTAPADEVPADSPADGWPPATVALDLARQMVAEWRAIGAAATRARHSGDPTANLRLEIAGMGKQQMEAARLAAWFATVALAEDVRAIRLVLVQADDELRRRDEEHGEQP